MKRSLTLASLAGVAAVGSVAFAGQAAANEQIVQQFSGSGSSQACQKAARAYPAGVAHCRLAHGTTYSLFVDWSKENKPGGGKPSSGSAGSS
ncbi:hypothetical protein [Nocardia sp. NPDC060249]|uniref:hypothetical protein n=1 Tax=Nocardia sp. NPDC060249 TaxID=3347082 RepID=UPI0036641DBD